MPFGPIRQPVQATPFPEPHDDVEYLEQRFQAYYDTPHGVRTVICVDWNTRQHRAIFIDGNHQRFTVDVRRDFQITLLEVLELHGIVIHEVELMDVRGQSILDTEAALEQSVEDMEPTGGSIWSQAVNAIPIQQLQYQVEAAG